MDVFQVLMNDHDKARQELVNILLNFENSPNNVSLDDIKSVCQDLEIHMEIEEKHVYPEFKKIDELRSEVEDSVDEHNELRECMTICRQWRDVNDISLGDLRNMLQLMEHHVTEEENDVFPVAKRNLQEEVIQDMTRKAAEFRQARLARINA
jgi:hemerythrin-like domain-containing protein